jgi:GNAT superfamily N-acetyltransferase
LKLKYFSLNTFVLVTIKTVNIPVLEQQIIFFLKKIFNGDLEDYENTNNYAVRIAALDNEKIIGVLGYYFLTPEQLNNVIQGDTDYHYYNCDYYYFNTLKSPVLDWGAVDKDYRNLNIFKTLLTVIEHIAYKNNHKQMIAGTIIPEYFAKNGYTILEKNTLVTEITTTIKNLDYCRDVKDISKYILSKSSKIQYNIDI